MANEKRLIALDEAIAKVKDDGILGEGYSDDERIDDVCDILESCEIVDAVEVVHGRWKHIHVGGFGYIPACSECGWHDSETNYCPNCGAKMDGDGNG